VAIGQVSGQIASKPLFSSEEFGYGGQDFGRAYDPSELVGDSGIKGSLEIRYLGLKPGFDVNLSPYAFYDIGKVWNEDTGGISESGSSAGFGVSISHSTGFSGNFGLAYPLTRKINTPIDGNPEGPRYLFQARYSF
jgi:hemolysin activation/secretion protein